MKEREARGVVVDICPQCSGLWIDWFDGELVTVASNAGRIPPGASASEAGSGDCPKCHVVLTETRYQDTGPAVLRCGECAGAFVAREALDELISIGPPVERGPEPPSRWSQLIEQLKSWLGG